MSASAAAPATSAPSPAPGAPPPRRGFATWAGAALAVALVLGLLALDALALAAGRAPLGALGAFTVATLLVLRRALGRQGRAAASAEARALGLEARFRSLVEAASEALTIVERDTTVRYASPAAGRVLGVDPQALLGRRLADLAEAFDADALDALLRSAAAREGPVPAVAWQRRRPEGAPVAVESTAVDLTADPAVGGFVVSTRDVSERRALEQQLRHQAFHDGLTGLPNRALFADRVERALTRSWRTGARVSVLFLDLDNFKSLNDGLGHAQGDRLLQAAARRILACLRSEDTAARLGGDEFGLLLEDLAEPGHVAAVCERLTAAFREPFALDGGEVALTVSVGVAVAAQAESREALLRNADTAMYAAKAKGGGGYEVFEPAMHAAAMGQLELRADLRRALEQGQLALAYQPIHELVGGALVGVEALVRWTHPTKGPIAPSTFVPAAESTGLIVPLGRWVLEQACRQAASWTARLPSGQPFALTVNLSARQLLEASLVDDVRAALAASGLAPHRLVLELTESVLVRDRENTLRALRALKELGVRLAIDDFGTGYSSLSYLRAFPIDVLKVAKTFVDGVHEPGDGPALAHAILSLGHTLRLETIAEGIESLSQARALARMGCGHGQGYAFAPALFPEAFEGYLAQALAERADLSSDAAADAPPLPLSA